MVLPFKDGVFLFFFVTTHENPTSSSFHDEIPFTNLNVTSRGPLVEEIMPFKSP